MKGQHEPRKVEEKCCDIYFIRKMFITCSMIIENEVDFVAEFKQNCSSEEIKFYETVVKIEIEKSLMVSETLS